MLADIVQEWNFSCTLIWFHFLLQSQQLTHLCILNFLGFCKTFCWVVKNIISCFLISFTPQTALSVLFVNIFHHFGPSFIQLETWYWACGYCAYVLFLCFLSLWNIPKKAGELGMGCRQFHTGISGLIIEKSRWHSLQCGDLSLI